MARTLASLRLAVLIDGENFPAAGAEALFRKVDEWGDAAVRRVYGDPEAPRMAAWMGVSKIRKITPGGATGYSKGKNSSDIALCIDAMELLLTRRLGGFCIVSSDSDFTHLAQRIHEHGLPVFGVGEAKAAATFREACDDFEIIAPEKPKPQTKRAAAKSAKPASVPADLEKAIRGVVTKNGWSRLSSVEERLKQQAPKFAVSAHGADTLEALVRNLPQLDRKPASGRITHVRLQEPASKADGSKA